MDRAVSLSKTLSYLLRHGAQKAGLQLGTDGYASLDEVLALPVMMKGRYTSQEVTSVVDNNDKKRFTLKTDEATGKVFIRANQGHSIEKVVDLELTKITDASKFPTVLHGTYIETWPNIKKAGGLSKMSRNHMHFATGEFGSSTVISGMRKSCTLVIYIDLEAALKENVEFFLSSNGVVLSAGINGLLSSKFFTHVLKTSDFTPLDPVLFPNVRSGGTSVVGSSNSNSNSNSNSGGWQQDKTKSQKRNERRNKKNAQATELKKISTSTTNDGVDALDEKE